MSAETCGQGALERSADNGLWHWNFIEQLIRASLQSTAAVSSTDVTVCMLRLFLNVFISFGRKKPNWVGS